MSNNMVDMGQINLDNADALLGDLISNVVPWIGMADQLHRFIQIAESRNISSVDYRESSRLMDRVMGYVEQYCKLVTQKLEQGRYR